MLRAVQHRIALNELTDQFLKKLPVPKGNIAVGIFHRVFRFTRIMEAVIKVFRSKRG
jgi:hypothetical protein